MEKTARRLSARRLHKKQLIRWLWILLRAVLIIGVAFLILYPLFVKFTSAIKSNADMYDPTVYFLPKEPTLANFRTVWNGVNYPLSLLRTIEFVLLVSLLTLASCTLTAYGFARFKFPGSRILFALVLFVLIIPPQVILLPLYLRFTYFNPLELFKFSGSLTRLTPFPLTDSVAPFVLLAAGAVGFKNSLYIFMLRQQFKNAPAVLEEAAYIDGCGDFRTFYRIFLPGARPMLLTVFLFTFVWTWNDYSYVQVLAPRLRILSVELMNLSFSNLGSLVGSMEGSMTQAPKFLLLIAPLVILYLFTQRFFTEGIERSGIVG